MAKRKIEPHFEMPEGATPLDLDEIQGLLIDTIMTQGELNFAEQQSIIESSKWIFETNHKNILTDQFFKNLHKKMFQSVWAWAGKYRTTNKNIGVEPHQISTEIKNYAMTANIGLKIKLMIGSKLLRDFTTRLSGFILLQMEMVDFRGF